MKRLLLAVLLAGFAANATADDPTPSSSSMSGTPKAPKPTVAPAPKPEKISPVQQKVRDLDLAKAKFMAAVGACPKPEDCDPASPRKNPDLVSMLKGGEDAFMEACVQCATDAACEQERDRIRVGRGRMGHNVCQPPGTKPKGMEKEKKAAPAATPVK
jgi:hypothetical protein